MDTEALVFMFNGGSYYGFTSIHESYNHYMIIHEKPSKLISRKMTNDGEIVWHVKSDS